MKDFLKKFGLDKIEDFYYDRCLDGGMASNSFVYKDKLGKNVVVKMLISPRNDNELNMFKSEAEALNEIPRLIANGCTPQLLKELTKHESYPIYYYLMEYFDGDTLKKYIADNPLPWNWKKSLIILHRIATALRDTSLTHVHRDLHFGNIYLTDKTKFCENDLIYIDPGVRILDFGCVKKNLLGLENLWTEDTFRHFGAISSWSPEFLDNPNTVTQSHDSWSLGVILYRFLVNNYPIRADNFGELVDKFRKTDVNWDAINKLELPYAIDQLLRNLLSFGQNRRFIAGQIIKMCSDILYRNLLDCDNDFIDNYISKGTSIYECLKCGKSVNNERQCNHCGSILEEDDMCTSVLKRKNVHYL